MAFHDPRKLALIQASQYVGVNMLKAVSSKLVANDVGGEGKI